MKCVKPYFFFNMVESCMRVLAWLCGMEVACALNVNYEQFIKMRIKKECIKSSNPETTNQIRNNNIVNKIPARDNK